jgi:hypothetical protein
MRACCCAGLVTALGCTAVDVSVGAYVPEVQARLYIEAEQGMLSGGFSIGTETTASGGAYLAAPPGEPSDVSPGASRASYVVNVPADGDYVIWGRIRAPDASHNRFWFQLDDGAWHKWRISTGTIWFWDDLHEDSDYSHALTFPLSAGAHRLVLASCVEGVWLDRLYFSAEGDTPPGNDTLCRPPHSIDVGGNCLASCGAQQGRTCGAMACAGKVVIPAYDCDVCCGS